MTDKTARKQTKPFADWLREQGKGTLHDELSTALADVVQAVGEQGKAGSIVLKVTVKPLDRAEGMVTVAGDVTIKTPKGELPTSMFFFDDEGNLSRHDPRQMRIPLQAVAAETTSPAEPAAALATDE